jgi:hypothetical protein
MKSRNKSMIFAVALICSIILISSFTGQTSGTNYAIMRTMEVAHGPKIILAYDGKTEVIALKTRTFEEDVLSNILKINQTINMLSSKGYELVAQSGDVYTMTYSFVKK